MGDSKQVKILNTTSPIRYPLGLPVLKVVADTTYTLQPFTGAEVSQTRSFQYCLHETLELANTPS